MTVFTPCAATPTVLEQLSPYIIVPASDDRKTYSGVVSVVIPMGLTSARTSVGAGVGVGVGVAVGVGTGVGVAVGKGVGIGVG